MSAQPIQLRRRTVPERLEYLADQLDRALADPDDRAGRSRVRSVQMCLMSMVTEFTDDAPAAEPAPP